VAKISAWRAGVRPGPDQYLMMITVDDQQIRLPVGSFEEFTAILGILNSPNPEYNPEHKSIECGR
jgi:hypothetical protein